MQRKDGKNMRQKMMNKEEFKRHCDAFGGSLINNEVCIVDGFPMGRSESLFKYREFSQTYETMDPDDFLELTGWKESRSTVSEESLERIKKRIENKLPLDVPFIDKDVDRGFEPEIIRGITWFPNHEGRHRALACKEVESCKKVPVIVYHRKRSEFIKVK